MNLDQALQSGETYLKNAEDALDRKVVREDQLYIWDNQVEVLDAFLADTEDLAADSPDLADLRDQLRERKNALERKSMEFLAEQEGEELPPEPTDEEAAEDLAPIGHEFIEMADDVLSRDIADIEALGVWEDPLSLIKSYLADSEPYVHASPELEKVRGELKVRKAELEKRISDLVGQWREQDMAAE